MLTLNWKECNSATAKEGKKTKPEKSVTRLD
jgi:hypothetical protein